MKIDKEKLAKKYSNSTMEQVGFLVGWNFVEEILTKYMSHIFKEESSVYLTFESEILTKEQREYLNSLDWYKYVD